MFFGKSSQNSPILVLIFLDCIPCAFCLGNTLLKVVSHYDLSVPSMSVMGFPKQNKNWIACGSVGWALLVFLSCTCPKCC